MRKLLKLIGIGAGVFLAVLVVATAALRIFFPSAKLRRIVESQIRTQLNREAQVGDISLGLRGISLGRFKLSEVPSLAEGGTFLVVDKMEVRWALMPLLSKTVLIQAVVLEKPQISIVRKADGKTLNVTDLLAASSADTPAPSAPSQPDPAASSASGWSWAVQKIQIKNGMIRFDDRSRARQTSSLSDIDLMIRNFSTTQVEGTFHVKRLENPVYTAQNLSVVWVLKGLGPTLGKLNGTLTVQQGPGLVQNLGRLADSSPSAKLAVMPLVMLQQLDRSGFIKLGLPDFSRLEIQDIQGNYTFQNGVMSIDTFDIHSTQATIGALGTIQLVSEQLAVDVTLHSPKPILMGEMDLKMSISGTLSQPKTNLDHFKKKAFKATVNHLLNEPGVQKKIDDTLKSLFH